MAGKIKKRGAGKDAKPRPPVATKELLRYELEKRSGFRWDQLPGLALAGDRESIARCAGCGSAIVQSAPVPEGQEDLRDWLMVALADIGRGIEPNKAFGWVKSQAGATRDFSTIVREVAVIESLITRIAEHPERSLDVQCDEVGALYSLKGSSVKTLYKRWRNRIA